MSVGFLRIIQIRLSEQNDTLCVAPECFYRGSMLAVEKDIRNKILFLVKMDPHPIKTFECRLLMNNVFLITFGDDPKGSVPDLPQKTIKGLCAHRLAPAAKHVLLIRRTAAASSGSFFAYFLNACKK